MNNPDITGPSASRSTPPGIPTAQGWDRGLLVLLVVTLALVGVGGCLYLRNLDATARAEAESKLAAVSELKIREITHWRGERLRDATYIRRTPYAARRALDVLARPESKENKRMFTGWLDAILANGEYTSALLMDTNLNICLTHPARRSATLAEPLRQAIQEALRTRQVTEADLYRVTNGGPVRLSLVVPLVVRREGTNYNVPAAGKGERPTDRSAGALVLTVNPEAFLYPLIRSWPLPSRTAETLLVRREGDEVVYLNELRAQKGTALALRMPLRTPQSPAAMAARGRVGPVQGVDYRGVPVLATLRPVPDTPWFIVTQVDEAEVYAAFRRQAYIIWGGMASLILAAGLAVILLGRRRYVISLRRDLAERKAREKEIERLNRLYATLSEINQAIVRVKSPAELFREVCRVAVEFGGFKLVYIGERNPQTGGVNPLAWAGEPQSFVQRLREGPAHDSASRCLCRQALEHGQAAVANHPHRDLPGDGWESEVRKAGLRSAADIPIRVNGEVWGVLAVYSAEADAFKDREVAMLTEATGDIAFGLVGLEREERREQAEQALRESEEKHRLLVQTAREAIFVIQHESIQFANGAAGRLVGLNEADLIGKPLWGFVHPEDHALVREDLERLMRGDVLEIQKEYRTISPDGAVLWLAVNAVRMIWKGKPAVLCLAANITGQRHLEAQLRQAQKMEAVGQLAGGVAHDFNNLLAVIRGNAELLMMGGQGANGLTHECLSHIAGAAERGANLTRQLLIFSRKQVMQSQPVALNDLIGNLTKMLKRVIREDISLDCTYGRELPFVQADPGMLEQVLLNLVVNARDAMAQGGRIHVGAERLVLDGQAVQARRGARAGEFVCLSVEDTGTGIASEILPRIFEPFFTTKDAAKGTGLGLATVYGIVEQHDGWVEVATQVGKGSTFRVLLPAIPAPAEEPGTEPVEARLQGKGETILLVEDDPPVRMITRRVLESFQYKVHEASSARHALEVWRQHAPGVALLLTDIVMPDGMTGRDLAERLRAERPDLRIVFMSGYSAEVLGQDTGFFRRMRSAFLQKPCAADVLLRTVRQSLDET